MTNPTEVSMVEKVGFDDLTRQAEAGGQAPPIGEWLPIESAPRRTLMVAADHGRDYYAVGCINAYGEFEQTEHDGRPRGIGFYPTHWMPLPEPPK